MSESETPPRRQKSWRGRLLWVAGVAILAAGATVYSVPIVDRLESQHTKIAESTQELDALLFENADLQERLDALNTPIEIERLARERLGYVREGETAFIVVSPREPVSLPSEEEPVVVPEPVEGDPWYERWWSYLSGGDLSTES